MIPPSVGCGWLRFLAEQASYSPPLVLTGAFIAAGICYWYLRRNPLTVMRRAETWDCGLWLNTAYAIYLQRIYHAFPADFRQTWIIDEQINKDMQGQ